MGKGIKGFGYCDENGTQTCPFLQPEVDQTPWFKNEVPRPPVPASSVSGSRSTLSVSSTCGTAAHKAVQVADAERFPSPATTLGTHLLLQPESEPPSSSALQLLSPRNTVHTWPAL